MIKIFLTKSHHLTLSDKPKSHWNPSQGCRKCAHYFPLSVMHFKSRHSLTRCPVPEHDHLQQHWQMRVKHFTPVNQLLSWIRRERDFCRAGDGSPLLPSDQTKELSFEDHIKDVQSTKFRAVLGEYYTSHMIRRWEPDRRAVEATGSDEARACSDGVGGQAVCCLGWAQGPFPPHSLKFCKADSLLCGVVDTPGRMLVHLSLPWPLIVLCCHWFRNGQVNQSPNRTGGKFFQEDFEKVVLLFLRKDRGKNTVSFLLPGFEKFVKQATVPWQLQPPCDHKEWIMCDYVLITEGKGQQKAGNKRGRNPEPGNSPNPLILATQRDITSSQRDTIESTWPHLCALLAPNLNLNLSPTNFS